MLKIDSNCNLKLSRGDDVKFPLFLNQGTKADPIRYAFQGPSILVQCKSSTAELSSCFWATLDQFVWFKKMTEAGQYIFIYDGEHWTLGGEIVNLEDYGLKVFVYEKYTLKIGDSVVADYKLGDDCEVYFEIYNINEYDRPIFKKTFTSKKDLWHGKMEHFIEDPEAEPNGDMKITLLGNDETLVVKYIDKETKKPVFFKLKELEPGEYAYKISAKLYDKYERTYVFNTVTNRLKLYLIDDDYSERDWS